MPAHLVQTIQEHERFDKIWLPIWLESGYELESYIIPKTERYIFFDKHGDYGSLELIPYDFANAPLNQHYPFNKFTFLKEMKIIELEKLAITKRAHGIKKLHDLLLFVTDHLIHNDFDGYIALLNPQVYNALVWRFKIPLKKLVVPGFSSQYIPTFLASEDFKNSSYYERVMKKVAVNS